MWREDESFFFLLWFSFAQLLEYLELLSETTPPQAKVPALNQEVIVMTEVPF